MKAKNKTIKFLSSLIIISIMVPAILFSIPQKASAQSVLGTGPGTVYDIPTEVSTHGTFYTNMAKLGIEVKKVSIEVGRQILIHIGAKLVQSMTKSILTWINTGYYGNPLFLENPQSFFKDIAKSEVKTFIDEIGYDSLRQPFGKAYALQTIDSYKRQSAENMQYTLSKVISDPGLLNRYRNDFNVGGWNGFLINTQYPQNNYLGYQMLATDEIARRVAGTETNAAQTVKDKLQQGMGFLSPQTCSTNTRYNNLQNEFQQPKWNEAGYTNDHPFNSYYTCTYNDDGTEAVSEGSHCDLLKQDEAMYQANYKAAQTVWGITNACPPRANGASGLESTTPGSIVGHSVMNALDSNNRLGELNAAMGNSISSLVDALLNKFTQKGLNKLASKVNPPPLKDDWTFEGQTLGSPAGTNANWDAGPDQEIILADFQKAVNDGIDNTTAELALMGSLTDAFSQIWPQVRELDMCQPGPDVGWQTRTDNEQRRNSTHWMEKLNDENAQTAEAAVLADDGLRFAVDFFKDWINNQMLVALPHSVDYMDSVAELPSLQQQSTELLDAMRLSRQTLARLNSLKPALDAITTQPAVGSGDEKIMIDLWKRYDATVATISNSTTVASRQDELDKANEQLTKLVNQTDECKIARTAKGWTNNPVMAQSINTNPAPTDCKTLVPDPPGTDPAKTSQKIVTKANCTEEETFCSLPIEGGYGHGTMTSPNTGGDGSRWWHLPGWPGTQQYPYPALPLVNAADVPLGRGCNWWTLCIADANKFASVTMSCDTIYNATPLNYKGDLPGINNVPYMPPANTATGNPGVGDGSGGQCIDDGIYAGDLRDAMDVALANNPSVANSSSSVQANKFEFLALVAQNAPTGFNITDEVKNGNDNPNTGDALAIWKDGDEKMERYDVLRDNGGSIAEAVWTDFTGRIPLDCTAGGGGSGCSCDTSGSGGGGGTGAMCTVTGGVASNSAPFPTIDLSKAQIVNSPNAANWAQTTTITNVSFTPDVRLDFDKKSGPNQWPGQHFIDDVGGNADIYFTVWLFIKVNGQWVGSGFNRVYIGGGEGGSPLCTPSDWYYSDRWAPMPPHQIKAGEEIGFMVTAGDARNNGAGDVLHLNERSNAVIVKAPAGFATFTGGTNPPPPTPPPPGPPPPPGSPFITSITPTTATPGVTTITINGTNLTTINKTTTATVQFYYGPTSRTSVDGTVNSAHTQVTVLVPAEINTTNTTIKIYRDGNTVSNPYQIQISGSGGGGGTIPTTTPTSSWSPPQSANNWWPALSPDGRYVSYGNWGENWLTDLQTKETHDFAHPSGLPGSPANARCIAGQWITSTTLSFVCYVDNEPAYKDKMWRYEVKVGEWIPKQTSDNPSLVAGNWIIAEDGHWASFLASNPSRIVKDNQVLATGTGAPIAMSGNYLVYPCDNNHTSICVRNGTTLSKTYTPKVPLTEMDIGNNYIAYGGYGPIHGIDPTGRDIDLTVTPWRVEGLPRVVMVNGSAWLSSSTWNDARNVSLTLLRPWGEKKSIVLDQGASSMSVVYANNNFIIAKSNDKGRLTVVTVPANSTRIDLSLY